MVYSLRLSASPNGKVGECCCSPLSSDRSGLGCRRVRDRVDRDVIAVEGLHECLGHAIALRAFEWSEARHEVECQCDLDGSVYSEDRSIVGVDLLQKSGVQINAQS